MARVKADRSPRAPYPRSMGFILFLVILFPCCLPWRAPADSPPARNAARRAPLDASLVALDESGDVNGIVAIRAAEIFALPEMARPAAMINEVLATQLKPLLGLPFNLPVKVQDIDQVLVRFTLKIELEPVQRATHLIVPTAVRLKKPYDWVQFIKAEMPRPREVKKDGVTYYELDWVPPSGDRKTPGVFRLYVADERTIVLDPLTMEKLIEAKKKPLPEPAWAAEWKEVEGGLVAVLLSDPRHSYAAKCARATLPPTLGPEEKQIADLETTFARTASRVVVGVDVAKVISLSARFTCDKPADAAELEKVCATFAEKVRRLTAPSVHAEAAGVPEYFSRPRAPAAGLPAAFAQAAGVPAYFSRLKEFKIPFTEPEDRGVRVLLQVSEDIGRTWQHTATANPGGRSFLYTAPHEGWCWFTTQTQDADNHLNPPDSRQFQPHIKVCVDTRKPVVTLRQVAPREGTVAVEWDIQDDNPDLMSLRIDYRPLGSRNVREWLPLRIPPVAHGEQGWTPPLNIALEVHLWVRDKAGNVAEATASVTPGRAAPGATAPQGGVLGEVNMRRAGNQLTVTAKSTFGLERLGELLAPDVAGPLPPPGTPIPPPPLRRPTSPSTPPIPR